MKRLKQTTSNLRRAHWGDKVILTLFTRTGAVSTHPVHPTDVFKFAETGEVAGK